MPISNWLTEPRLFITTQTFDSSPKFREVIILETIKFTSSSMVQS